MCRLLGYCSRDSASVAGLLTQEGLGAFTALSHFHCDGWGMAWYDADAPQVRKSPRRAAEEPEYARLAQRPLGDLGLVHLRWATPGLGIGYPNSHPFRFGPYTFAHNGAVHPQDRLGELLPAEWERRLAGSTDSERYLLHIMWRLEIRRGDMIAAVADTVASIAERYAVNSLNAVLLSPAKMYVISWHDPARIPADELRRRGLASTPEEVAGYFHLACRATPDAVVVASSGWPQPGWTMLPNNSVLAVDRVTLDTSAFSLEPASRSPARRLPARVRHPRAPQMIMGMWPVEGLSRNRSGHRFCFGLTVVCCGSGGLVQAWAGAQPVAWIFSMLVTVFWKAHSPLARGRPRRENRRKPRLCLILPKGPSAIGPRRR
jgi:predicted glutamine amidotransferase